MSETEKLAWWKRVSVATSRIRDVESTLRRKMEALEELGFKELATSLWVQVETMRRNLDEIDEAMGESAVESFRRSEEASTNLIKVALGVAGAKSPEPRRRNRRKA
jgi:hypothetical protein